LQEARVQVMQHAWLVEMREARHVLRGVCEEQAGARCGHVVLNCSARAACCPRRRMQLLLTHNLMHRCSSKR
jgi:hypothetical protein